MKTRVKKLMRSKYYPNSKQYNFEYIYVFLSSLVNSKLWKEAIFKGAWEEDDKI